MRKPIAVLFSLLLATSLAACSDDGDDESGSPSASASGTEDEAAAGADGGDEGTDATDDPDSETEGEGTEGDDSTDTEGEGDEGDDAPVVVEGDFCQQAEIFATDSSLGNLDFNDPADIDTGVRLLENFRDAAPDEIKGDLQVIVDGFRNVAIALREAENSDDPAAQEAMGLELQDDLAALATASENVGAFTLEECGIDINGGTADPADPADSSEGDATP